MIASTVTTLHDNSAHGEDTFLVRDLGDNEFLDAVMDGVTNHGGEEASASVSEALEKAAVDSPEDVNAILEQLNEEFYQVGGGRFLLTTASVALCRNGRLWVISAGDSPAYHIRPDSYQQLAGRVGGLLRMGTAKAIGAASELNLRVAEVTLEPGDRLVLATDGITDNLQTNELIEIVRDASSPEEATKRIAEVIASRLEGGYTPEVLGGRYRHDDQTGIIRFF